MSKSPNPQIRLKTVEPSNIRDRLADVLPYNSKPWYLTPHLLKLNLYVGVLLLSATTMGFDGSMINGLQGLDSWTDYFGNPNGTWLGLLNAAMFLGGIILAFPAAWLSDTIGRRYAIMIGIVVLTVGAAVQGAAQNIATFIVSRFIVGLGVELCIIPAPVLITEIAYPTHRGKVTSLFQTCFYLGSIASSWITFGTFHLAESTWSWRIPSILQAFFPLVQLVGLIFVPESPRWLVSKGKLEQARAFFVKHHAGGESTHPLVDYEMRSITDHIESEVEIAGMGWPALWKTPADRRRLALVGFTVLISQWSGNSIITYYLALVLDSIGIKDSFTKTLINGILQIFNFFAAILGAFCVDRLGRRTLWLISCTGMLVTFTLFTALSAVYLEGKNYDSISRAVIAFIFIFFFFYDVGVTPLTFGYPTEILPFHNRQKGIAVANMCTTIALTFNAFVNPIAIEAITWKYYLVYVVALIIITIVVYLFFAETKGHSLEEISEIFEGSAIVAGAYRRRYRSGESDENRFEGDKGSDDAVEETVEYSENTLN
ncbi:sugar transporter [Xylaria arbuscula]|nr:sugar transporter [Xylaria arbuscula]